MTVGNGVDAGGVNDSFLSPGDNSIGNLKVGELTFASDGTLNAEVNPTAVTADRATVKGAVNLGSAIADLSVILSGTLSANQKYVLVDNDGTDPVGRHIRGPRGRYDGADEQHVQPGHQLRRRHRDVRSRYRRDPEDRGRSRTVGGDAGTAQLSRCKDASASRSTQLKGPPRHASVRPENSRQHIEVSKEPTANPLFLCPADNIAKNITYWPEGDRKTYTMPRAEGNKPGSGIWEQLGAGQTIQAPGTSTPSYGPGQWLRPEALRAPTDTILLVEVFLGSNLRHRDDRSEGWMTSNPNLPYAHTNGSRARMHPNKLFNYLFIDGHVTPLRWADTVKTSRKPLVDLPPGRDVVLRRERQLTAGNLACLAIANAAVRWASNSRSASSCGGR